MQLGWHSPDMEELGSWVVPNASDCFQCLATIGSDLLCWKNHRIIDYVSSTSRGRDVHTSSTRHLLY